MSKQVGGESGFSSPRGLAKYCTEKTEKLKNNG